ncbi:MAG: VWA domain-containing protein [Deltaproteobacteria bacterium]|nr:VWA domain-containing protein [Deltaproteobacteria bacterium]
MKSPRLLTFALVSLIGAAALAADPAVVRPRMQVGKEVFTAGTAFFIAAKNDEGAVAVATAHQFEIGKLVRTTEVSFETARTKRRASVSSRFLVAPGKAFSSATEGVLSEDFMVFALDLKPSGVRVLEPDVNPVQSTLNQRVRILGVPSGTSADEDDLFGTVRAATEGRIEVRLDVPADLRGWGGAPVVRYPGDQVIGILEAAWPEENEGTLRLGIAPIGAVLSAMTKPLAAGRGEAFAKFVHLAPKEEIDAVAKAPSVGDDVDIGEERELAQGEALLGEAGALSTTLKLEIEEPHDGGIVGSPEGAFLAGRALALLGEFKRFDVIVVIDTSSSTSGASGADINGNGVVGASGLSGIFKQSDPGDSILAAEIAAAKRVIESLDPRNTRVGVVSFAGESGQRDPYTGMIYESNMPAAITEEPLTTNFERVGKSLDRIFKRGPQGATNITEAVRMAVRELRGFRGSLSKPDSGSQKVVMFFTDGRPTAPYPMEFSSENTRSVLRAASQARRADVQIHTFAIGKEALDNPITCVQLAAYTGGYFFPVSTPGDLPNVVEQVNFANLESLEIKNLTNGSGASETIINADGSFGALVPVQPGLNRLEVVAKATDGTFAREEVTVSYAPGAPSATLPRELVAMRNRLLERRLIAIKRGRIEAEREAAETARKELEIKIKREREAATAEAEKERRSLRIEQAPEDEEDDR